MKKLIVTINEEKKEYPIIIGDGVIDAIDTLFDFGEYSKIAVITGDNVPKRWVSKLRESIPYELNLISVPGGERSKSIDTVIKIWNRFQEVGMDRKSLVINLGGGVICDMGGFAASTYLRGIDFLQVPTTVLAQVDASVGGKVGINFNNIKNYIGVFQQPIGVVIDVDTLSTLPRRVHDQGFAEIIKHGLIADRSYFMFLTSKKPHEFNTSELTQMLAKSNEIKSKIVEEDHREKGVRKLVNFGHTVGHAIESLSFESDKPLLHGEAVSVGMYVETKISEMLGLLEKEDADLIYEGLKKTGLPVSVTNLKIADIISKLKLDKKSVKGQINWTLLDGVGHGVIDQKVDDDIVEGALRFVVK